MEKPVEETLNRLSSPDRTSAQRTARLLRSVPGVSVYRARRKWKMPGDWQLQLEGNLELKHLALFTTAAAVRLRCDVTSPAVVVAAAAWRVTSRAAGLTSQCERASLHPVVSTGAATMLDGTEPAHCTVCCCTLANKILMVLFMVLLIFAILFGNAVTLAVVLGTKHFHTPQGYLKASLAVADLAVGIFVVPLSVYAEVSLMVTDSAPEWTSYNSQAASFHPCNVIGPIFAGCTLVSITTIFLLTIERSIAVLRPLHKDSVITRKRTTTLIIFSWVGSFFLAVSPMVFSSEIALEYNSCSRMCNYALGTISEFPSQAWNILLLFPAFDFTLLGSTVVINIISLSTIRQHSRRRKHLAESECQSATKPTFSDIKAAKTIGTLTLAFTASFTPIAVFVVGNVLGNEWCNFSFFAFWILATNSCWNVIIYSVRDQKFRLRAHKLFIPSLRKDASKT
uniref:olfactory receptor 4D9 n=1 Tax=Centroberyx gerrardi TaxID=166262 RepID=UPI003AABC52C